MTAGQEWSAGKTVAGRYVLVRVVGTGSHGQVWRADDLEARRPVALKVLQVPLLPAARLEREALAAAALDHPHILRTHALVRDAGRLCLVQDYVSGGDARSLRGRPWREWVPALDAVAAALEAAHAAGLVHLDLTPGNVLLDADGRALLADFGVAAAIGSTGTAPGSAYARSPAQWRGEAATPADDLYGLGALAHEWLAGHPPYYPDVRAARVLAAPPERPLPAGQQPTPPALVDLIVALLAADPAARPAPAAVRATLATIMALPEEAGAAPMAAPVDLQLRPSVVSAPAATTASTGGVFAGAATRTVDAPRNGLSRWAWAGIAALGIAAVAVLVWRPAPVVLPPPPVTAKAAPAKAATPAEAAAPRVPADPAELQRMAAAKTAAEEQRERYRKARAELEKLPVAAWGGEPWAAAQAANAQAQARYEALDFAAAGAAWAEGTKGIAAVQAARAPALAAALAAGRAALAKPDSRAAATAFTQALAIQPGLAAASAGLKRAQTLDEVVHLVDAARIDEQAGRAAAAEAGFQRALALDGETVAAREGLARLQQAKGEAAFRSALAEGWRLLGNGQRAAAAAAFRRASALRPGAPEAAEGLAQVSAGERSATLGGLRAQAQAAERGERWAEAEKLYAQALQLEPGLSYATEGTARTAPRARLDAQLQGVIDEPAQALRPSLRQMARLWLEQAAATAAPNARVQRQATAVARILAAAERPVPVSIESDGQTQVVLLRVKRLGTLSQQTLELLPGRYVLVGTREGYRDVRREIDVAPDSPPPSVVVSCQERI